MKKLITRRSFTQFAWILSVCGVLALSVWAETHLDPYVIRLLHMSGIYAILAVTFNLVYGFTGQFSLGHAGLAAVGAYTVGLLTLSPAAKSACYFVKPPIWPISAVHWPLLPSLVLAGLLTGVVGAIIGAPALRLRGDYLCMATLGFSEIIRLVFANLPSVTNGALGLKGIPSYVSLVWTTGAVVVTVFVVAQLVNSSYGRALKAIRDDEIAAEAVGVNLFKHKLIAFIISSFFVGVAGGLLAQVLSTIDPNTFTSLLTFAVVTMVVLGGAGSITGSVIAAGVYAVASELLRAAENPINIGHLHIPGFPGMRMLTFAVTLLFLILFYREGLMSDREFSWLRIISTVEGWLAKAQGKQTNA